MSARKGQAAQHNGECDFWCGERGAVVVELVLRDFPPVEHNYCHTHAMEVVSLKRHARGVVSANIIADFRPAVPFLDTDPPEAQK
jgi:hypothetical protein